MTKKYQVESVDAIAKAIDAAPVLEEKVITRERMLEKLSKKIVQLHTEKHYDAKEIAAFLAKYELKCSQKEIKEILQLSGNEPAENSVKITRKRVAKVIDKLAETQ